MTILKNLTFISALAASLCAQALHAQTQKDTLCHPQEGIFFSCVLRDGNIVSLCTSPDMLPLKSVEFRFGTRDEIKASYFCSTNNNRRFSANFYRVNPKASVRQVWFDLGGSRYIVTHCLGGRCAHSGGVAFYHRDRVNYIQACKERDEPWFKSKVIDFGSGISDPVSHTELIRLDDDWTEVEALYPYKMWD